MEGNLTKGPILKTLTKLAVPIMASAFLGTLYNITDMAWIGLLGSRAVAGVGVGGMFTWLSQGLAAMARMGGQVQVAQCIGRGDRERAHALRRLQYSFLHLWELHMRFWRCCLPDRWWDFFSLQILKHMLRQCRIPGLPAV